MMVQPLAGNFLFLILFFLSSLALASDYQKSVLQVTNFRSTPDYDIPWSTGRLETHQHLAAYLGEGRFVLSAYGVSFHTLLEGSFVGSAKKFPLKLEFVDYLANIAFVRFKDENQLPNDLKSVPLGKSIKIGDQVQILNGKQKQKIVKIDLNLRNVVLRRGGTSDYSLLHYEFETQLGVGLGWSEPLVKKGQLVGIAVGQNKSNIFALPATVIARVLKDFSSPPYRGFGRLGIKMQTLDSPHLRKYLKVSNRKGGILITSLDNLGSLGGKVKPRDVLLSLNGKSISEEGYIRHQMWGAVHFIHQVSELYAGETVVLDIMRNGRKLSISAPLLAYNNQNQLIPPQDFRNVPYLIFGGLLFEELSQEFLNAWGTEWSKRAPVHLVYQLQFRNELNWQKKKRIIVLNRVIPDLLNKGYQNIRNAILVSVNSVPITSFPEMRRALNRPIVHNGKKVAIFRFSHGKGKIILPYEDLLVAHKRMSQNYKIPVTSQFFHVSSTN